MAKENRSLLLDNSRLVNEKRACAAKVQLHSSSSSSSSQSSSNSDDSDSSSESERENEPKPNPELETWVGDTSWVGETLKGSEESWASNRDDTGYESERSTFSDR